MEVGGKVALISVPTTGSSNLTSQIEILLEDNDFVVINKPYGVVVNRAESAKFPTIQDWMEEMFHVSDQANSNLDNDSYQEFLSRSGVVHRLDKDTSGVLLLAKTPQSFINLKNQFKQRETEKTYLALAHGTILTPQGTVNAPIERSPFNRMHFGVFPGGREAVTNYKVIANYELQIKKMKLEFAFLQVEPLTGRTHQIRVHLKYAGHPLVADPMYSGRKNFQLDQEFCPRLFLHAWKLRFLHPKTNLAIECEAPLPNNLESVLKMLTKV